MSGPPTQTESDCIEKSEGDIFDKSSESHSDNAFENSNNDSMEVLSRNFKTVPENSHIISEKDGIKYSSHTNSSFDSAKHRPTVRKHRVRHIKRRKWKPYSKLTWDERKKLEERDARRACRIREEMTAHGLTLAPYNTTQFLMEDHNLQEPDYELIQHESKHRESHNGLDSDEFYSSPDDEEDFLQQQFLETYDSVHDAYINNMTKFELVRELMRLEDEVEILEKSLAKAKNRNNSESPGLDVDAELEKIKVFKDEIEKLMHENEVLAQKNERLHKCLSTGS